LRGSKKTRWNRLGKTKRRVDITEWYQVSLDFVKFSGGEIGKKIVKKYRRGLNLGGLREDFFRVFNYMTRPRTDKNKTQWRVMEMRRGEKKRGKDS